MANRTDVSGAGVIEVRPMREGDLPAVLAIAAETPTAPHWPGFEWRRLLAVCREEPQRRAAWVAQSAEGEVRGFAAAARAGDAAELEIVAAAPAFRRHGVGLALAGACVEWARAAGVPKLLLEVRASNAPALGLYRRLGFLQDGVRPRYYRSPEEDAVLFSLDLESESQDLEPEFQNGNSPGKRAEEKP